MASSEEFNQGDFEAKREFATTHWSVIKAVGDSDVDVARTALQELCQVYWYPLYTFVRRQGENADSAADFTQAFFADLLQREDLKKVDPKLGRFRSFLMAALKNFLRNQWNKKKAKKRGGGQAPLSIDFSKADTSFRNVDADQKTAEQVFERQWALTLLDLVHTSLRRQFEKRGKAHVFNKLQPFLGGGTQESTIGNVAKQLGMTEVATKVAIHRLRVKFGEELRIQIRSTVESDEEVEDEIQYLFGILQK